MSGTKVRREEAPLVKVKTEKRKKRVRERERDRDEERNRGEDGGKKREIES